MHTAKNYLNKKLISVRKENGLVLKRIIANMLDFLILGPFKKMHVKRALYLIFHETSRQ